MRARCEGNWSPQTSQFSGSFGDGGDLADGEVMGSTPAAGNDRLPDHPTRQRGTAVSGGMVENRSFEMSVEMLSPSSAGEVCGVDAGRYNAGTVLPQGASDVQSIRASQTADPRAKQTHPFGPARRSARVNTRRGDGDSPGSMPARRFHLGEVVESCLAQSLLAGRPPPAWPQRAWDADRLASTSDRAFRSFLSSDLLILDDLGLHRLTAQQSADLYELILNRHRSSSFIITSNRAVDEWLGLFDDPILGNSKPMPVVRAVQIRLTHVWSPACKLTVSRVSGSRPVKDWCVLPGQQHGPEVLRLHYW